MTLRTRTLLVLTSLSAFSIGLIVAHSADDPVPSGGMKKWQQGKGWGWVWGKEDEVGSLSEMTDASRLAALKLATQGKSYDLGVTYDRTS